MIPQGTRIIGKYDNSSHVRILFGSRAATTATSMAVVDRRRLDRTRRAATQWRAARAKLSCLARNGRAATRGRKLRTAVAVMESRRSAATTAFG